MADIKETNIKEDVERLKEWYSKQLHLPQNIDEYYFYNFVCGTNSLEKAKRKIDAYFSLRKKCVEKMTGVLPHTRTYKNMLQPLKWEASLPYILSIYNHTGILPDKTPDGYRVAITVTQKTDPANYNLGAYHFHLLCMSEIAFEMWPTDMNYLFFENFKGIPFALVKTLDLMHTAAIAKLWSESLPAKLKDAYVMNAPNILLKAEPLVRSLFTKKINERIHMCQDESKLKEILPASMLPAEFGGKGKSMKELADYWTELIDSKASWFEERLKLCSDESKRSKDSAWKGDLNFGMDGSFKKLNID